MKIGQRFTARINGREESLVYWGTDNGVHCAKRNPSDWALFYLKPEQIPD